MTGGNKFIDSSTHDILNGVIKNISPALIVVLVSLLVFALIEPAAGAQSKLEEFFDVEYGYLFNYPAGWAIRKLPEGESNPELRVMLQGPNGSSFTVVIEKLGKTTSKEDFESSADRKKIVEDMISQTLEQTYKVISQNIKAKSMTVGERRDLSNENGIKFYVATLHAMPVGKSIIVAGIHAFPFGKNYSVNFVMSTFWDPAATQDRDTMTAIFNSFRLIGENGSPSTNPDAEPDKPAAK
jgi:hypothetical protein